MFDFESVSDELRKLVGWDDPYEVDTDPLPVKEPVKDPVIDISPIAAILIAVLFIIVLILL